MAKRDDTRDGEMSETPDDARTVCYYPKDWPDINWKRLLKEANFTKHSTLRICIMDEVLMVTKEQRPFCKP
jgi:hypothetical protein